MHDSGGVLQIQPFTQQIRGDQQIGFDDRRRLAGPLSARCKGAQHLLAAPVADSEPA